MRRLLPPTLFMLLGFTSVALGWRLPLGATLDWPIRLVGIAIVVGGLALTIGAAGQFESAATNITTFDDPGVLVTTGAFGWSRNPMYLGFAIALAGLALVVGTPSAATGPLAFVVIADRWYIPFEERRSAAVFGEHYGAYRRTVRRWLGRRRGTA